MPDCIGAKKPSIDKCSVQWQVFSKRKDTEFMAAEWLLSSLTVLRISCLWMAF